MLRPFRPPRLAKGDDEKQLRKAAQAVLDAFNGCPMIEVRHRQALTELQAAMTAQAGKHQGRGRPKRVDESKVRKLVADGLTITQVAAEVDCTPNHIHKILRKPVETA